MAYLGLKKCSKCKQYLAGERFYKNKRNKDGLHSYCIPCQAATLTASYERKHAVTQETKRCNKCRRRVLVGRFRAEPLSPSGDGLAATCEPCQALIRLTGTHRQKPHYALTTDSHVQCMTCRAAKPVTEFHPNKRRYTGLQSDCKDCQRAVRRQDRLMVKIANALPTRYPGLSAVQYRDAAKLVRGELRRRLVSERRALVGM